MRRKASVLARSMILTFLLTLLLGSLVVHADEGVKINHTSYTLNIGDEDNVLQLKIESQQGETAKPRWISYNVNVATVDQYGYVTPLRKGTAIISSGIGIPRQLCIVTVVDPSVKLNKPAVTLYRSKNESTPGNTVTLTASVNGATKKATDVVWSSSDESVAKVVEDVKGRGVVTSVAGEGGGTAVITARVNGRTATCKVTVLESTISLNVKNMQLSTRGTGSSIKLVPTVVGSKKTVKWTSDNPTVATVSGGKVTGKKASTEPVTVTAEANGVTTTCKVTVVEGQISINEENVLLYMTKNASGVTTGETNELKTNAANGDVVEWFSDNESAVTVAGKDKGKATITAVGAGKATITARCNGKEDTCEVEVKNTSTSIAQKTVYLKTKGAAKTYTLGYQVVGRKKNVAWKSSDTKVVSVSKGKVTAKKAGEATVTMTANGVTDKVKVIVEDYKPTIALNQNEYILYTTVGGNTIALKATVDGTSKKVTWKSSDDAVAKVDTKGKVTANSKGMALITAEANGVTAKCWISVKEPKIILERNAWIIKPGEKGNLYDYASIEVTGAKQSVTYKSSDAKTVAVDKKGNITGKKVGSATITIKANGIEETCYVTVSNCGDAHTLVPIDEKEKEKYVRRESCEESGLNSEKCSVCGGIVQTVTPPAGHSFGKWTVVDKATENAPGLQIQKCANCDAENTKIIPAKNKGEVAYGYKLEWEDDFNGNALDRDSWNVELHDPGWVNAELQAYVDSTDNIYVKDGNLVIQAIKNGDSYTSGRISTQNKHDYTYGRFEVRAQVPSGKGFLPAFWMMPTDENYYGQWPKCGEIDIMEVLGHETNKAYSTLHFGEPHTQTQGTYEGEVDLSKDFHVYACEWDPGEFRFYVDDKLFYTVNDWFTKKPGFDEKAFPAPYDQPFYMILNLAVGGSWVGYPDESTEFGDNAQLVVDYVRVYQKDVYDTDVDKPVTEVILRDPDENGNYIINGDFAIEEDLVSGDNWQLLTADGGEAAAEIKENALHVTTTNAGAQNHSVQIVQAGLPMEKGSQYKLTYDAYADEERTMITDISAPDRGWGRYLADTKVTLTTEKQSFEHIFDMTSDDDANGRLEFNLGNQGSTAKVHISNVKLVKTDEKVDVPGDEKSILPDGNYVYNGSFDEGNESGRLRLAYWDWDIDKCRGASVSVTSDAKRELKVVVPKTVQNPGDVVVYQEDIAIKGGKEYILSFDARADQEKTIQTTIAGETFTSGLTTEKQTFRYNLNTAGDLNGSELCFLLGTAGITYIDDISIREDGLFINGDFSSGLVGYEVFVDGSASAPSYTVDSLNEKDAFSIDIEDTGDADWKIQLKQNNIELEEGKWYKIGFDAKSTVDRKIMYALQRDGSKHNDDWTPYSGSQIIDLTKDYQTFSHTFKMTEGTDPETIFSISMGAVGGTQITTKHTVVIDNIILEETDPVEIPSVEEGKEMILNGDFSEGDAHWENAVTPPGEAEVSFADGKATYKITNVGEEDYHIQLKYKEMLTLEKGAEYAVKFKIKSTAARTVKYAFLNPTYDWYGGEDLILAAGEEKEVNSTLKVTEDTSDQITFQISMGQIYDHWDPAVRKPIETPISTIEIDDISVKKIGGTGGDTPEGPVEIGAELIKNGDFAKGDTDWSHYIDNAAKATTSFEGEKARYEITNAGAADWNVQLKQEGLAMEKGASYKVNFKIGSSISRDVRFAFMGKLTKDDGETDEWYGGDDIKLTANKLKSVSRIVTLKDTDIEGTLAFQLSMGQIGDTPLEAHAIEITNISVTKVAAGATADAESEEEKEIEPPSESGQEPEVPEIEPGTNLIKNGNFKEGKANWLEDPQADGGVATFDVADEKAVFEITDVGTEPYSVQLKQEGLTLEKGATYEVKFNIMSSIARDVIFELQENGGSWAEYGLETISLDADVENPVKKTITVDKATSTNILFFIGMGKIGDTEISEAHTIKIDDVSVTKISDADEKPEKDPVAIGTQLIKNGNFADGESGWVDYYAADGTDAKRTFEDNKVRYEITNAGKDIWDIVLKQADLEMEKDASYKVNFKIGSSIDRDVKMEFQDSEYQGQGNEDISLKANMLKSVSRVVTLDKAFEGKLAFQLSLGQTGSTALDPHAIEISDISVTKVADGTEPDDETEEPQNITPPGESEEEPDESEESDAENLIKNGDFAEGVSDWENVIAAPGAGEADFTNGKAVYNITNVGNEDWNVQLKQSGLTLEKGAEYKVSFKIRSSVERTVKSVIMNYVEKGNEDGTDLYDWYAGNDKIELTADKEEDVAYDVKVGDKETSNTIQFAISMGKIGDETISEAHTIEISDIKLIKVKDGTDTEEKNDTETETTPPESKSGAHTNNDADDVEEVQEDQNTEDQDVISDDTADDEDADSVEIDSEDSEISDTQNDSRDAETSDDQGDSGSSDVSETLVDDDNAQTPQN